MVETRPPPGLVSGNTLFYIISNYIVIPKNFLSSLYSIPIISRSPFLYLFSFLSLPAALPCRCDFPMRRYSVIRSSSTAPLTGSWTERHSSQIEDNLSFPAAAVGLGIPFNSRRFPLPFPHFLAVWSACKIYPDKEVGTASDKREEKFNQ